MFESIFRRRAVSDFRCLIFDFGLNAKSKIQHRRSKIGRALVMLCSVMLVGSGPSSAGWMGMESGCLAAPKGPQPAENAVFRQVSIDNDGVITYIKSDGIYTFGRAGGVKRQVAVGDEAPRAGGRFAEFLDVANTTVDIGLFGLGAELRIAFKARVDGGAVSEGIFLFSEIEGVSAMVLPGDIAPNTGGGTFSQFPGHLSMSRRGTVLFRATVVGGTASEGLFFSGLALLADEATIDSVAVQGEPAPDSGGGTYSSFVDYALIQGQLLLPPPLPPLLAVDVFGYIATIEGGGVSQTIYLARTVVLTIFPQPIFELQPQVVAATGRNVPGRSRNDPATYARFKMLALTPNEVVFLADVTETETNEVFEGIYQVAFIGPIPLSSARVLQGGRAPIPGRTRYHFVSFERMAASSAEELVFIATLDGGGPSKGLFSVSLGPFDIVTTTLLTGQDVRVMEDATYADLGPLAINGDGLVVFQARLNGGDKTEAVFRELAKRVRVVDAVP